MYLALLLHIHRKLVLKRQNRQISLCFKVGLSLNNLFSACVFRDTYCLYNYVTFCDLLLVARKDNAFVLKMTKTEEAKTTRGAEKKKEEKRLSMHSRAGTEESIPLLQLHIGDGEHPVLSKKSEAQETQPDEPSTSYKDSKPLIEENANTVDSPGTFI